MHDDLRSVTRTIRIRRPNLLMHDVGLELELSAHWPAIAIELSLAGFNVNVRNDRFMAQHVMQFGELFSQLFDRTG